MGITKLRLRNFDGERSDFDIPNVSYLEQGDAFLFLIQFKKGMVAIPAISHAQVVYFVVQQNAAQLAVLPTVVRQAIIVVGQALIVVR
ncbi:6480_t:CDS:2 [Paraglomus brasilianum]|uniref:6480_t:CDS:1 n=1 Tax=Paraglomus brasilianum TaxID=144538 RepID=A0A9N9AI13_9GLOM|nr:6480_t:CDS:2 [Paraglomus brasilianum]